MNSESISTLPSKDIQNNQDQPRFITYLNSWTRRAVVASLFGLGLGFIRGLRESKDIVNNQLKENPIKLSREELLRHSSRVASWSMNKQGIRYASFIGGFVAVYSCIELSLDYYRDTNSVLHDLVAATVTGGIFNYYLDREFKQIFRGMLLGASLGLGIGLIKSGVRLLPKQISDDSEPVHVSKVESSQKKVEKLQK